MIRQWSLARRILTRRMKGLLLRGDATRRVFHLFPTGVVV